MARLLLALAFAAGSLTWPVPLPPQVANPFTGERAPAAEEPAPAAPAWAAVAAAGRALSPFSARPTAWSRSAGGDPRRRALAAAADRHGARLHLWLVHALGPGHGKVVVVSFFQARAARIGEAC